MSSNRSFGLLFFIVFFIIGLWPLKNNLELNYIFIGISIIFLILGLMNSKVTYSFEQNLGKIWRIIGKDNSSNRHGSNLFFYINTY